jgi:hypothetical protein
LHLAHQTDNQTAAHEWGQETMPMLFVGSMMHAQNTVIGLISNCLLDARDDQLLQGKFVFMSVRIF